MSPLILSAQNVIVDNGLLYTHDEIPKIHITIDPDSLDIMYLEENWYEDHEYLATFVFESSQGLDTLENIGFRFRGNTSRDKIKKSFKVSLNTYIQGQKFDGVEKINLNAETNDPAMMRSRLCWDFFHDAQITAPRSNHTELYINGDFYGLYLNTEHIDDEFVNIWFGNKSGNLYKCTYPADLNFISNNPDDYKVAPWDNRTYDLKTNQILDDYTDLAEFIGFLNQSSDADFACRFSEYFNVYNYLKIVAVDILTGNWDGYMYNQNNFYLYHNPLTGQFEYIPYDTDNTWGIDWLDRDWSDREIYEWSQGNTGRPLYLRLMDDQDFRDIFSWHLKSILDALYYTETHQTGIENLQDFIQTSALSDPYRPLDYGFDDSQFLNALTSAAGGHVDYGIFPFADARKTSAYAQLENNAIAPVIWHVFENFVMFPNVLKLKVVIDGPEATSLSVNYELDGVQQAALVVSGSQDFYELDLVLPEGSNTLTYNVQVTGGNGLTRDAFCESRTILLNQSEPTLVINEIMSSNGSTIADEHGDYDDWIELHNYGTQPINLNGFFLSDNDDAPTKWALPAMVMNPGSFLLVWADSDIEQGPLHTNFNISASGEGIYLFKEEPNGLRHIDQIQLPPLPTNYTFGREVDAQEPWILFWGPTPGVSNHLPPTSTVDLSVDQLQPYPNPTTGILQLPEPGPYILRDVSGRTVKTGKSDRIDLSQFENGVYMLSIHEQQYKIVKSR